MIPFVQESIEPGNVIHTDGWLGYDPLKANGYIHKVTYLRGNKKSPSELLPRVHRVVSLLKRWLLGTHQGAVSPRHLDYYLDEFTFRFNRRNSRSRGKLFFRLVQQAVVVEPTTYRSIIDSTKSDRLHRMGRIGPVEVTKLDETIVIKAIKQLQIKPRLS